MITITREKYRFTIEGHAGYAPKGQDIVCAAVSALYETLLESFEQLAPNDWYKEIVDDTVEYRFDEDLSMVGMTLIESFFIGVGMIAEAYPECVKIVQA